MILFANIAVFLVCAIGAAWWVPLGHLSSAFTPLITAVSIMAAAVLVRLNRGMPTIDWKGVEPVRRKALTEAIVKLAGEYLGVLAIIASLLVVLIVTTVAGKAWWELTSPEWVTLVHRVDAALIVGLSSLALLRMGYVAWRDYDVVRMQKVAVDQAAEAEDTARQIAAADQKIAGMKAAGVQRQPKPEAPKAWET